MPREPKLLQWEDFFNGYLEYLIAYARENPGTGFFQIFRWILERASDAVRLYGQVYDVLLLSFSRISWSR